MSTVTADIVVESELWASRPQAEAIVRAAIAAAAPHSTDGGEVSILLSDDSAVRELNRQWRGLDQPTNVLSFPAAKTPAAQGHLGDIVIAYQTLQRNVRMKAATSCITSRTFRYTAFSTSSVTIIKTTPKPTRWKGSRAKS
jgi:ssRNA-specific RNase YbeY (16S rRNA maturation enzyme)